MTRNELIVHLTTQECYSDEECDSEYGQLWHNAINGQVCYVPYKDELALSTWAHVIYELRIDPPLQYDSFYHVYQGWRDGPYKKEMMKEKKEQ